MAAKPKQFVGLLISPTSLEAVQCSRDENGAIAFDFYHHLDTHESGVDEEGDITNPQALGELIADFWRSCDIRCRNVVLGFAGKRAIARLVSLPRIPANQLQQVVLSEAEQYTLFRDEEPLVDYFTVDTDTDSSTVFYAAVSQKLMNAYKKALQVAKLRLIAIDIAQYAALRAMVHFKLSDSEVWDGVIVQSGRLVITSWFGQKLLNWREVSSQRWDEEGIEQRFQFIETEISRTLRSESGREREILVAKGSLAETAQMSDYFQRHTDLHLQATGIDYWCRRLPPEALSQVTPAALGLALWGLETRIPTLDLLNRSGSKQNATLVNFQTQLEALRFDRTAGVAAMVAGTAFVAGLTCFWYIGTHVIGHQNSLLKGDIAALTSTNSGLSGQLTDLQSQQDVNQQILTLIGNEARTNLAVSLMAQVNDIMPADAWLTSIKAPAPNTVEIKGMANSQSGGLTLARMLTEYQEVSQVQVKDLSLDDKGIYTYTIDVTIDPSRAATPGAAVAAVSAPQESP
ncbi:MAG TPA: pilus assembly protein PilM [Oscillatoriaceae cyanobacterium]